MPVETKTFTQLQNDKREYDALQKQRADFLKSHQKNYTKMITELAHMLVFMNDGNPTEEAIDTISRRMADDIAISARQFTNTARIFEKNGK